MVDKPFEITVKFQQVFGGHWYPIVQTIFLRSDGTRIRLPLLFDTGADSLVLHPDYEIMFSNLQPQKYKGIGSAGTYDGKETNVQNRDFWSRDRMRDWICSNGVLALESRITGT